MVNTLNSQQSSNSADQHSRICSSPINSLKMSSRVCQIKIDEGLAPHVSRELKSERETQNTLKLQSSCDDLVLTNNDYCSNNGGVLEQPSLSCSSDRDGKTGSDSITNSPTSTSSQNTFRNFRNSESCHNNNPPPPPSSITNNTGNMPSPSMSSCYSYSNSSSPTTGLTSMPNSYSGLLSRCLSPSTTTSMLGSNHQQNYFSQSPSPTRKLFVTRRSMSPVTVSMKPSMLTTTSNQNKRKCNVTIFKFELDFEFNFS
jgi:hypothetical protein